MLYIYFGDMKDEVKHPDIYMESNFVDEWFDDSFVKEMVLDIDKTEVISAYNMVSPVLGGINYNQLSSGVKTCIIAYKTDCIINASRCGDNCAKWLLEISKKKDITIALHHLMKFRQDANIEILNNNKRVSTYKEYLEVATDFV